MRRRLSSLLPIALAACACVPPAEAATAPPDASLLASYHWQLMQATDHDGQRIDALFVRPEKPVQLDFAKGRISVRGTCNGMGGSYRIENGHLVAGPMMHTMMACPEPGLNRLDGLIGQRLASHPVIVVTKNGDAPQLQLRTAAGDTLDFEGTLTAEARYGGPGVTRFLEVAARNVPCHTPTVRDAQCMNVREVHYDAHGLKSGTPGPWEMLPLDGIEGYMHQAGVRNVLRVRSHPLPHAMPEAAGVAYVLDMVVESSSPQP